MSDAPEDLDAWVVTLADTLGLGADEHPIGLLLDLTRDAAHGVTRPAGPLTTYLVGLAVAQGMTVEDAAARTRATIAEWKTEPSEPA
ncbi:DUF6457 domain-containing protein [Microbacterium murale]|uniref:DUF6457 domain-containing protein n=1 Tax=Microbacterium murale TaxID=1081040 RepID=A0ABU0P611_9MICO|nr:DUF6457 domain-containing protein [Microbacterium murale]MDQ0642763.1 hypothetical protein [Microbacterium murale]